MVCQVQSLIVWPPMVGISLAFAYRNVLDELMSCNAFRAPASRQVFESPVADWCGSTGQLRPLGHRVAS